MMARMTPTEARAKIQSLQSVLRARGEGASDRKIPAIVTALTAAGRANMTAPEVAAAAGVSEPTIRQWVSGRTGNKAAWPKLAAALAAADFADFAKIARKPAGRKGGQTSGLFRQGREPAAAKGSTSAAQPAREAPTSVARPKWAKGPAKVTDPATEPERVVDATLTVDQADGSIVARIRPTDHRYVDFVRELGLGLIVTGRSLKVERRQG
jgi:transcriptional regulator with XRE-family HTH domain